MSAKQRGQILPLGLAALLAGALALSLSYRLSLRLIQREEARMRTDVIAFSGAVQYSRALNVLAACEKVIAAGWVATVVTLGEFYSIQDRLLSAVDYLVRYGPWLTEASTVANGLSNGQLAIPFWNKEVLLDDASSDMLKPSFNVKIRDVMGLAGDAAESAAGPLSAVISKEDARKAGEDLFKKANEPGQNGSSSPLAKLLNEVLPKATGMLEATGYSYKRRSDGQTVQVGKDGAGPRWEKGPGGGQKKVYKTNDGTRYVKKDGESSKVFNVDLEETGPHLLTVLTLDSPYFGEGARPGWVLSVAQVQIDGGSLDMLSFSKGGGMGFRPRFVPVRLFKEQEGGAMPDDVSWQTLSQGLGSLAALLGADLEGSGWRSLFDTAEALQQGLDVQH